MSGEGAASARDHAATLVHGLALRNPELVEVDRVDIGPALEQQLFFALRDGVAAPSPISRLVGGSAGLARLAGASAASLLSRLAPRPGGNPIVVLVREPTHYQVLARLEGELQRLAGEPLVMVRVGRAASVAPGRQMAPRLASMLDPSLVPMLATFHAGVAARLPAATASWSEALRHLAARELPRIALGAAALSSMARRWRPALMVALDEIGTWARLLPAVSRRHGVPSLDLPHAEAADPVAIDGAGYDRMAVYGRRSAAVLRGAGIAPDRIEEIGAPRFDPLLADGLVAVSASADQGPRRVVYAAQYVTGAMTGAALAECRRAALAVATAAAPSELVVVPHPADPTGASDPPLAADQVGVTVRVARDEGLQDVILDAWAMVTGWSNSVFEAAIAGVPSITVNPGGVAPVAFAAEGLSLAAADAEAAADVARSLLDEPVRQAAVARARAALPAHIGVPDGCATERAARLVLEVAGVAQEARA